MPSSFICFSSALYSVWVLFIRSAQFFPEFHRFFFPCISATTLHVIMTLQLRNESIKRKWAREIVKLCGFWSDFKMNSERNKKICLTDEKDWQCFKSAGHTARSLTVVVACAAPATILTTTHILRCWRHCRRRRRYSQRYGTTSRCGDTVTVSTIYPPHTVKEKMTVCNGLGFSLLRLQ